MAEYLAVIQTLLEKRCGHDKKPAAGRNFFRGDHVSGNNLKSKKSFLEAPHQDETLRQNIWHLFKGTWKNFVGMI